MSDLNHSCKGVCSGWQHGYERGQSDKANLIEALEKFLKHEDIVTKFYDGAVMADFENEVEFARKVLKEVSAD